MMHRVLPLLAAAATATLAQDRLLAGQPLATTEEPIATTEEPIAVEDRSACDSEVDWDGLKVVVKEELHVDLDYDGLHTENLAALKDLVNAVGGIHYECHADMTGMPCLMSAANRNAMPKLQKWVKMNGVATALYVLEQSWSVTWSQNEFNVGSPVDGLGLVWGDQPVLKNDMPTLQQNAGLLMMVDFAIKALEIKAKEQKPRGKRIIRSLERLKMKLEKKTMSFQNVLDWIHMHMLFFSKQIEKFVKKHYCP